MVLSPETPVTEAATTIIEKGVHYFPIVENGKLLGVITKKDIVKAIALNKIGSSANWLTGELAN